MASPMFARLPAWLSAGAGAVGMAVSIYAGLTDRLARLEEDQKGVAYQVQLEQRQLEQIKIELDQVLSRGALRGANAP